MAERESQAGCAHGVQNCLIWDFPLFPGSSCRQEGCCYRCAAGFWFALVCLFVGFQGRRWDLKEWCFQAFWGRRELLPSRQAPFCLLQRKGACWTQQLPAGSPGYASWDRCVRNAKAAFSRKRLLELNVQKQRGWGSCWDWKGEL